LIVDVIGLLEDPAVFFLHGTPGSRQLSPLFAGSGRDRGICHVSYSRPGYEGSDRDPGRAVVDCAADVTAIADALGIETFYVVGESGGGPHALAVAASMGSRVRAVGLMCSSAPCTADGFDWAAGFPAESLEESAAALAGEAPLRAFLEGVFEQIRAVETTEQLVAMLDDLISPVDRKAYENELADHGLSVWQEVAKTGFWGWFDDDLAQVGEWGFPLDRVRARVDVWHGRDDRTVPPAHGEWLVRNLPNARLTLLPNEGHNSMVNHYGAILDRLLAV
jgi:pimeloyl-ACP methyl ester carboxylesterase